MTRTHVIILATIGTAAAVLLPLLLAGVLAYRFAFSSATDTVENRAEALAEHVSILLGDVATGLERTDSLPLNCTPAVIQRLRELAFDIPEIIETGLMRPDGSLICSSWGPVDPPIQFDVEDFDGEVSLKGPVASRVIGRMVLVSERQRPDGGWSNALLQPRTLVGMSVTGMDSSAFVALLNEGQDQPLVSVGLVPTIRGEPTLESIGVPFDDGIERLIVRARVPGHPDLTVVSATTRSAVMSKLWNSTALPIGIGLLISSLLGATIVFLARRRLSLRAELERAIQERSLRVHYQPVVDIRNGRCIGVEALLRWRHESRGNIRPDLFLPMAEDAGLIDEVTRIMLTRVMADLSPILRDNPHMHVAVNMPPDHLRSEWLTPLLDKIVLKSAARPDQVILEISERTFTASEGRTTQRALGTLSDRGLGLAMDDFGAGYSSMAALKDIELTYIKIDRHFVAAIGANAASSNLVDAIVDMANRLNVQVIAEGVETEEQLEYLIERGVESVQGFYYARPLTLKQLHQFLAEFSQSWKPIEVPTN